MADILAFVRNTPRTARARSRAEHAGEVVVFPGACVGMLEMLWEQPEEQLVAAVMDARTDN
jgi:hypothetical protein